MLLRVCGVKLAVAGFALSLGVQANEAPVCQMEWHNSLSMQDGALNLEFGGESFMIKPSGQLYFGIHKVKLSDDQSALLADYHRLMLDDLPYTLSHSQLIDQELCDRVAMRQAKESEIQSQIPALKRWQSVTLD
ncbi:YggN family protein [Photobacterium rosenbergii]|uniref:YggN family protein n=1 Tax=Photobacterium rosenbergii TaxID=294936 RepID=UPI001C9A2AC5|nr:YggN family protein [Photobacterium rosenbergii]MBY5947533.1 YggN family protein [Photobacterium rosenbergii]